MDSLPELDPLLHQPARTQLVAFLAGRGEATFTELKQVLGVTDGNLGAHLSKLTDAGYITAAEIRNTARLQKVFSLTPAGQQALAEYVTRFATLMSLPKTRLDDSPQATPPASQVTPTFKEKLA
jgi:DNA-binding MarR family transcriptional regulator